MYTARINSVSASSGVVVKRAALQFRGPGFDPRSAQEGQLLCWSSFTAGGS